MGKPDPITFLLHILRSVIISPETVWVLICLSFRYYVHALPESIGAAWKASSSMQMYLLAVPFTLTGVSYRNMSRILQPLGASSNKVFYEAPFYWKFKLKVFLDLIWCGAALFSYIVEVLLSSQLSNTNAGIVILVSLGIPIFVVVCQTAGMQRVKESFDLYYDQPKQ